MGTADLGSGGLHHSTAETSVSHPALWPVSPVMKHRSHTCLTHWVRLSQASDEGRKDIRQMVGLLLRRTSKGEKQVRAVAGNLCGLKNNLG